jgi:chemotaxis protein CheD
MKTIHVGIGEMYVSTVPDEQIKTFALGSCVAVIIYDSANKTAGLIHIALPDSSINPDRAKTKTAYFVDTGLPLLLKTMKINGDNKRRISIKLAGGSNIMDENHRFDIGKRNVLAIKKHLWKERLGIIAEDVGGSTSRTVGIEVETGHVTLNSGGRQWEL